MGHGLSYTEGSVQQVSVLTWDLVHLCPPSSWLGSQGWKGGNEQ
jgi:hypothetical protein